MTGFVSPQDVAAALGLPAPTAEQAAVIAAPIEPALVVAGAGAGKTETMAARVVWLVANGVVTPDRVLGLTFTRKAARQLADRVRARLRRLAGANLLDRIDPSGERRTAVLAGEPTVLTYHAYAGRIVGEHGLRLPVEPGARLLTETAAWQLAHRVVATWADDLDTDRVPATVTAQLLALAGELAEHLVDAATIHTHAERLTRVIESAPKGPRQSEALSQKTQEVITAQRFRVALLPLVEEYALAKRKIGALDFADQMALAAVLGGEHDEVIAGERERYGTVLLDEYQDTGHAQRVLLRALFGSGAGIPVTAVGDPAQAIYGWRGASAANLPRFRSDFPRQIPVPESALALADSAPDPATTTGRRPESAATANRTPAQGSTDSAAESAPATAELSVEPAARYGLLTSFRNPPEVLALANAVATPLRTAGLDVDDLRPRPGAPAGDVRAALLPDVRAEREWIADAVARRWHEQVDAVGTPPTAAVLVRRRADMADLAHALRARGLPVEVVGLGGLLAEPEVRDLVSALRLLVDPLAGTAAMRLLTGSRWRIGAADLAALWHRAGQLTAVEYRRHHDNVDDQLAAVADALPGENAEQAGLADALDDPGPAEQFSRDGYTRIRRLGTELSGLRRRLDAPLPELVADTERTLLLDIEAMSRPGGIGRAHLDAFADVVADYAATSPSATLPALLDYLATAERAEDGLEPGEVEVAEDRVQVLTVHAAKGLEWQVVAVPHLVVGVFPGRRKSSCWLRSVTELPADLRGDSIDLPTLRLQNDWNRKEIEQALEEHNDEFEQRRLIEDRRLLYVALTRSERCLLVSGHWWGETGAKPRGPSPFLSEIQQAMEEQWPAAGTVAEWAEEPEEGDANPLTEEVRTERWPADPLGDRRSAVRTGAELVLDELHRPTLGIDDDADDPDGWGRDVDVLLAERAAAAQRRESVALPEQLTVSQLVELADDPAALAARLRRPLPHAPNPSARRGTAFHGWLEQKFSSGRLLDIDELPGAADGDAAPDAALSQLQQAFYDSEWAERTPYEVEVPFETEIAGVTVRGRMDAVFADPDGGWTVVDWKTGSPPPDERAPALTVQLAAYRLAWAALSGSDVDSVRAAFHYVASNRTVRPADLLDAGGLRELLRAVPEA
ncbi:MAG TPA: ATP-dependent DNA helicase [Pseudonocardiaceae bacterium]|nr:ATP-dependent DNA helicase [Pseudonocardiaceae bacterium]